MDSLSEDWVSEKRSSSPAPPASSRRQSGSVASLRSQSRIPHLAENFKRDSSIGYLKPRSSRGLARSQTAPILGERTPSSLNVPAPQQGSSYKHHAASTLPRRPSSAFSDSQTSVQHHTLSKSVKDNDTPDWKRRLANGEDVASDGFDLFAPTRLEGMFKEPTPSKNDTDTTALSSDSKPWTPLNLQSLTPNEQYQSLRASRAKLAGMEVLEEVNEEEEPSHNLSAVSSELARNGSLKGLVKNRVTSLERAQALDSIRSSPGPTKAPTIQLLDPRWRTSSGQEELKNEDISPVTMSRQNTIRDRAVKDSMDAQPLQDKLKDLSTDNNQRPLSRSSDRVVSYGHRDNSTPQLHEESIADLTSQSLPEDLSMGTQDFMSHGGFVNARRGGYSNEASFLRKGIGSSADHSGIDVKSKPQAFRSSPPPYITRRYDTIDRSKLTASLPTSPIDESVLHHTESAQRPPSAGSPLKLFGNRDTFTNNKLMRILTQFEDPAPHTEKPHEEETRNDERDDAGRRMSLFGGGELDHFDFKHKTARPEPLVGGDVKDRQGLFSKGTNAGGAIELGSRTGTGKATDTLGNNGSRPVEEAMQSPLRDRTTKRRRTLLRDQIEIEEHKVEIKLDMVETISQLAGTKRKDAKPGEGVAQADTEVLASRSLLRPKPGRRTSSVSGTIQRAQAPGADIDSDIENNVPELAEALAAELETFAQGVTEVAHDSRKPSLATKDYMEEANKVMQFIRARGKPQPALPLIEEPSEIDPDAILDLELDGDSTKDSFSRPPSREGISRPQQKLRYAKHDSATADNLRRFKEKDDLELLTSTSVLGPLQLADNRAAEQAAKIPVPEDEQESSPPNMRILSHNDTQRKRKYSASTIEGQTSWQQEPMQTQGSDGSTQRTFPTSSSSSGQRGMITHGTVVIPDHVGTMTFDHHKKIWVKKHSSPHPSEPRASNGRQSASEEDPFDSIPDLSFDEHREQEIKTGSRRSTLEDVAEWSVEAKKSDNSVEQHGHQLSSGNSLNGKGTQGSAATRGDSKPFSLQELKDNEEASKSAQASLRSEASKHEARLYDGMASRPPPAAAAPNKQARAVTIAFSSPLIAAIHHKDLSVSDVNLEGEDDLPLDDSDIAISPVSISRAPDSRQQAPQSAAAKSSNGRHEQYRAMTLNRRPVSRIDEHEEDNAALLGMSLVHVKDTAVTTPAQRDSKALTVPRTSKNNSILCLTPLSDFTLHQVDDVRHHEQSFVEERAHPKALRQAHGSLALAVDALVKAITDAEPTELFWENIRRLTLANKALGTVHGLRDYCASLEELCISDNQIRQLGGLPPSLRTLDVHANALTSMTSWGHLNNLQYINVSGNQLESLEGFSSLVHLRKLDASNNQIRNIEGILDLDGLLELNLNGNELVDIDFESAELLRLNKLNLGGNKLQSVRHLDCLPCLELLNVADNLLHNVEDDADVTLMGLRRLNAARNELQTFDMSQFPALEELDLDGNKVRQMSGLKMALNLQKLSLREQKVQSDIVNHVLSTPNECREILLSCNKVMNAELQMPALPQYNIRSLELAGCGLSALPQYFGACFPNCRDLNLNFNGLLDIQPLQGMSKLLKLYFAKNRVKRLRRTCLVLSRLPALACLDVRDNPLTVGFYAPLSSSNNHVSIETQGDLAYKLPGRCSARDAEWLDILDEVTGLRRRTIELLLAQGCKQLVELDGLSFSGQNVLQPDQVWRSLTDKGVLKKPAPPELDAGDEAGKVGGGLVGVELSADGASTIDVGEMLHERSLMVE